MTDLIQRLRAKGGAGCQCGAWYYGECCCSNAEWPEQFISQAADVLAAIDALHHRKDDGFTNEWCAADAEVWPCRTHRILHPGVTP